MKGNNELHFNEATLIEAMQEYLDKRMGEFAPKVSSIKGDTNAYSALFVIKTEDRPKPETA